MGTYYKGATPTYHTISDNVATTSKKYDYNNGYFGEQGKSSMKKNRQIKCVNPTKESTKFYDSIANGGIEEPLSNGRGLITKLRDGTIITYRKITSTAGSPAVEINIKNSTGSNGVKSQKYILRRTRNEFNKQYIKCVFY